MFRPIQISLKYSLCLIKTTSPRFKFLVGFSHFLLVWRVCRYSFVQNSSASPCANFYWLRIVSSTRRFLGMEQFGSVTPLMLHSLVDHGKEWSGSADVYWTVWFLKIGPKVSIPMNVNQWRIYPQVDQTCSESWNDHTISYMLHIILWSS
jgi:hypothetical protein